MPAAPPAQPLQSNAAPEGARELAWACVPAAVLFVAYQTPLDMPLWASVPLPSGFFHYLFVLSVVFGWNAGGWVTFAWGAASVHWFSMRVAVLGALLAALALIVCLQLDVAMPRARPGALELLFFVPVLFLGYLALGAAAGHAASRFFAKASDR